MLRLLFILFAFLVANLGLKNVALAEIVVTKSGDSASELFSDLQKSIAEIQDGNVVEVHYENTDQQNHSCDCKPDDKDCFCPKEEHHIIP